MILYKILYTASLIISHHLSPEILTHIRTELIGVNVVTKEH